MRIWKRMGILVLLVSALMAADGCSKTEKPAPAPALQGQQELLIGLIPEQNLFRQIERYEPLAAYLSKEIGRNIKLTVLPRYGNIVDNFSSNGLDAAFFGSFSYALAHAKMGVEVLARPEYLNGTSTYHGLMFVRKDSGISSVKDMAGKRFAFVDKATTAGYLLPLAYFKKHNVNYKKYLKEWYFTGTHEDAILDVFNRKADVGAAKNTVFERISSSNGRIQNELTILEKSPNVPENGLAVRKDLDAALKRRLKDALLAMHEDPEGGAILKAFGARRFIETTEKDYQPVYRYAQEIELDLATYDYRNE